MIILLPEVQLPHADGVAKSFARKRRPIAEGGWIPNQVLAMTSIMHIPIGITTVIFVFQGSSVNKSPAIPMTPARNMGVGTPLLSSCWMRTIESVNKPTSNRDQLQTTLRESGFPTRMQESHPIPPLRTSGGCVWEQGTLRSLIHGRTCQQNRLQRLN